MREPGAAAFVAAWLAASVAVAQPDSLTQRFGTPRLMMSSQEVAKLEAVLQKAPSAGSAAAPAPQPPAIPLDADGGEKNASKPPAAPVHLDAVVYLDDSRWRFWLDGRMVSPERIPEEFTVLRVTPNSVRVRWQPAGRDRRYHFTLKPGQTFVPARRQVVDGRVSAGSGSSSG